MGTVIVPMQKKLVKSFGKIINMTGRTVKLEIEPAEILYTVNVEGAPQDIITPNETQD